MWTCHSCGNSNSDNANYCSNCGNKKTLTNHVGERASNNTLGANTTCNILIISVACLTLLSILLISHTKNNSQNNRVWASQTVWHKHKWGEWVEVTPATCESAGRKIRICKRNSSHVEEQEIPALGHDWGEWAVETQHGCETAGIEVRTCKNDPTHQERRDIPFLGHDWGDWSVETQPNCEAAGLETRTCRRDASHVEKREITELGHDWIPATFTQPQYCSRCGISSGRPSPESTFPTVEEVKYLFDHNTHNTVSNTGASLVLPNNGSFLSTPYRARVKASRTGGRIYIMPVPKSGNGNLGTIVDGTEVVIVAKQSGYLFFVSYDGTMGWNGDVFFGEH